MEVKRGNSEPVSKVESMRYLTMRARLKELQPASLANAMSHCSIAAPGEAGSSPENNDRSPRA
jgi:hypothetical protein